MVLYSFEFRGLHIVLFLGGSCRIRTDTLKLKRLLRYHCAKDPYYQLAGQDLNLHHSDSKKCQRFTN